MSVEGGLKFVKYSLFVFNFLFWICGLALIVVGVLVQIGSHDSIVIKDVAASAAPILIIVIGVVIFFIAFFGCCGAFKENYCMVTTFAVLLSVIIIAEIAAAITGYVFRNKISNTVKDSLADLTDKYINGTAQFKHSVDQMQEDMKCCGANSSADWKRFSPGGNSVPDSCCILPLPGCGNGTMMDPLEVYQEGCYNRTVEVLKKNILWVIIAALVIAFLQIMGLVFACLLMRGIRSGYEVM